MALRVAARASVSSCLEAEAFRVSLFAPSSHGPLLWVQAMAGTLRCAEKFGYDSYDCPPSSRRARTTPGRFLELPDNSALGLYSSICRLEAVFDAIALLRPGTCAWKHTSLFDALGSGCSATAYSQEEHPCIRHSLTGICFQCWESERGIDNRLEVFWVERMTY